MNTFNPADYSSPIAALLSGDRLNLLSVGRPDNDYRPQLEALSDPSAFAPHPIRDAHMAIACRTALWWYHDFLDEAHNLSQDLHTADGSYWHALVHRREPDYENSKYWFRRVGVHPIFEPLHTEAARLAEKEPSQAAGFLVKQAQWDPYAFVDLCEAALAERVPSMHLCQVIQRREWELLFDYCYQRAIGESAE